MDISWLGKTLADPVIVRMFVEPKIKLITMTIEYDIAIPGFLAGLILGTALALSRIIQIAVSISLFLYIIWIFVEYGESGIIDFFNLVVFDQLYVNRMFYIPLLAGLIVSLTSAAKLQR